MTAAEPSETPVRLAMWSGPRNISTAMMRSWENRDDCVVVDEPLYAYYLATTGIDHPVSDEVIAAGETSSSRVVASLLGPVEPGVRVFYQKHMSHHLVPELDRAWIRELTNVLLIRDPREVVASYVRSRGTVTPEDIGLPQQIMLYDELSAAGTPPPVIDASDFLRAPEPYLRAVCAWIGVPFTPRMLSWPAGPRESDGVWAKHWYANVWASTGFEPYHPRNPELTGEEITVEKECRPMYDRLHAERLTL